MAVGPENELWTVYGDFNDGPKTTNNLIARREAMIRNNNHSLYLKLDTLNTLYSEWALQHWASQKC